MNCFNKNSRILRIPVVLGLGSNMVFQNMNSMEILSHACEEISMILENMRSSSIYRTRPMYYLEQQDFFNMVVAGDYNGNPRQLLEQIHEIENRYGRNRCAEIRNGPRPLDIDIELFGDVCLQTADLEIPHPRMRERAFVLVPLLEICPEIAEPLTGVSYSEYIRKLPAEEVKYVSDGMQRKRGCL